MTNKHNAQGAITPRWLTFEVAAKYIGISKRTLENWMNAGHLRTANVAPMGTRGRRLIDREHLDRFIESFVGAPKSKIAMVERRKAQ